MKYLFILWIMLNLLFAACKDDEKDPVVLPEAIQQVVNESETDNDLCEICNVEIFEFEGKHYYNLYCAHWSCLYCNLYDENGDLVSGEDFNFSGFLEQKKLIGKVPMCGN